MSMGVALVLDQSQLADPGIGLAQAHAEPFLMETTCAHRGGRVKEHLLPFVGGARRSINGGPFVYEMSDRKSRLITICMLVGAVVMIGLVLTGTLQMRVSRSPVAYVVTK